MPNINYLIGKKQKQYNTRELSRTNDVLYMYDKLISKMTTLLLSGRLSEEDISTMHVMIETHSRANTERNMDKRIIHLTELNEMIKCVSRRMKQ